MSAPDSPTYENLPETHIERMDRLDWEHRHEMEKLQLREAEETKRAKYRLREERQETYRVIGVGFLVLVLLLAVIAWIYFSTSGDPTPEPDTDVQREIACVDNGGVWIPDDLLTSGEPLCVFPGKKIEESE
jgi:hypothetical protein